MQNLLSDDELRCLLEAERPGSAADDHESTEAEAESARPRHGLSGDLAEIDLVSAFETLNRTGSEGVLIVANPLEEHHLWFRHGQVRDWVSQRTESRRLGQHLVRARIITQRQLDEAIQSQREHSEPLGEILVRAGFATTEQIDEAVTAQALEDVYSLFVWTNGTTVFHPGPPKAEDCERLSAAPTFDIRSVLREVGRRDPEWQTVLEKLGGPDDIIVKRDNPPPVPLEERHAGVMQILAEGERSLRELALATATSLFDCAKVVKDLCDWKMVKAASPSEMLLLARSRVEQGDSKRAAVILRSLVKCQDPGDTAAARAIVDLLVSCNEKSTAAELLVKASHSATVTEERLALAREAHRCDPRSVPALRYLRERLADVGVAGDEMLSVCCALAEGLIRDGWLAEALEVVAPFKAQSAEDTAAVSIRVRVLCKLDRPQDAVDELLKLTKLCRGAGRREALAKLYQQVLRIDPKRSDIVILLKRLRQRRFTPVLRGGIAIVVLAAAALFGISYYLDEQAERQFESWSGKIRKLIGAGDPQAALRVYLEGAEFLEDPRASSLKNQIDARADRLEQAREDDLQARLGAASAHFEAGRYGEALAAYQELQRAPGRAARVTRAIDMRFGGLLRRLESLAEDLPRIIPPSPDSLDPKVKVVSALELLDREFHRADAETAHNVLGVKDAALFADVVGAERAARMVRAAQTLVPVFVLADKRRIEYGAARQRLELRENLEELWKAAREREEANDFKSAHAIYEKLAREHLDDKGEFRALFAAKRDRYEWIVRELETLEQATAQGDIAAATKVLEGLGHREPKIPFHEIVRLPLWIESVPAGAAAFVDGTSVGATPLLYPFSAATPPRVRVELDGFEPAEYTVRERKGMRVRTIMVKRPDWTASSTGVAERAPVFHGDIVLVVDRSGSLMALRRGTGQKLWVFATGDLSGLLPAPVVSGDSVLLASVDGPLRSLSRTSGELLWVRDGIPCEGAPVAADGELIAATTDGELVGVSVAEGGKVLYRRALPGPVHSDLQLDGTRVFLTTTNGWLVCVRVGGGGEMWRVALGSGTAAAPCVAHDLVAAVSTDGRLLVVRAKDGAVQWEATGLGEMARKPAVARQQLLVASQSDLLSFELKTGQRRATQSAVGA